MQATTFGRKWGVNRYVGAAILAATLVFVGLAIAIAGHVVDRRSDSGPATISHPVVSDLTTLSLDRDGADVFSRPSTAPDVTGLTLDRDGADIFTSDATTTGAFPDTTGLSLDRDGADLMTPQQAAPDITQLNLDRDGADIP